MRDDKVYRIIVKEGEGAPTIPLSNDHTDGTWIATDIYEGEFYRDILTDKIWNRSGDITIDLTPPSGISSVETDGSLSGDGTVSIPLKVRISSTVGNILTVDGTGLLVNSQVILDLLDFNFFADANGCSVEIVGSTASFNIPLGNGTNAGLSLNNYSTTEKSKLASITEIFTTTLKNAYDSTVAWISTNGSDLINHLSNTSNPHNTTKSQVGLNNVDNTSDINKPVSSAQATALGLKEDSTNKSTLSSESASTTKFPVWSAIVSYFSNSQILSILGISTLSGSNTGDETTASIQSKRPIKTLNGQSLEGSGNVIIPTYTTPTVVTLATAQASTSTVLANITGMSGIVVPFGGVYVYELMGAFSAVATTTGFNLGLNFIIGAGTSRGSIKSEVSISSTASATPLMDGDVFSLTASSLNFNTLGTSSTAGNNYIYMKIVINTLSATSNGTLNFQLASEVNASSVSILAGTTLIQKKIN